MTANLLMANANRRVTAVFAWQCHKRPAGKKQFPPGRDLASPFNLVHFDSNVLVAPLHSRTSASSDGEEKSRQGWGTGPEILRFCKEEI